jgi:hypothetical protein
MIKTIASRKLLEAVSGGSITCRCGFTDAREDLSIQISTVQFSETITKQMAMIKCRGICCNNSGIESRGILHWYSIDEQENYCHTGNSMLQDSLVSIHTLSK